MKHFLRIQRRFSTRQSSSGQFALGRGLGALLLAAVITGCGSESGQELIAEQITEALSGVEDIDIDVDGDTISYSIGGAEGYTVSSGQGTQLPEEFPDDVLVFDDAEIMSAVESADGLMVNLSSDADPDEIKAAYLASFDDNGWQQESLNNIGEMWYAQYSKGTRRVQVMLMPGNSQSSTIGLQLFEVSG